MFSKIKEFSYLSNKKQQLRMSTLPLSLSGFHEILWMDLFLLCQSRVRGRFSGNKDDQL